MDYIDDGHLGRYIPINYFEHITPLFDDYGKSLAKRWNFSYSHSHSDWYKRQYGLRKWDEEYNRKMCNALIEILNSSLDYFSNRTRENKIEILNQLCKEMKYSIIVAKEKIDPKTEILRKFRYQPENTTFNSFLYYGFISIKYEKIFSDLFCLSLDIYFDYFSENCDDVYYTISLCPRKKELENFALGFTSSETERINEYIANIKANANLNNVFQFYEQITDCNIGVSGKQKYESDEKLKEFIDFIIQELAKI